jgi:hypothetical protein
MNLGCGERERERERERTKSGTRWCERRYLIAKVCGFDENCDEFSKDAVMYTSTL